MAKEHSPIVELDLIQDYLRDHYEEDENLDLKEIAKNAFTLLTNTDNRQCVKYALGLLELFPFLEEADGYAPIVRFMAQCDEFTFYAMYVMGEWENGNDEVFELAKRVHGWGRIHCVSYLEPETQDIKDWLLYEGANNTVLSNYSAMKCLVKSGVPERLENRITYEEWKGIGKLLCHCIVDQPLLGIYAYESGIDVIALWLRAQAAELFEMDYEDCLSVWTILKDAMQRGPEAGDGEIICYGIAVLNSYENKQLIREHLDEREGQEMAHFLKMD